MPHSVTHCSVKVVNGLFRIGVKHARVPITVYHPRYQALREGLAALRKKAGLSQVQLAERLGVGQSFVSKIERGESYVDVMLFVDWCRACDVPRAGPELDRLTGT